MRVVSTGIQTLAMVAMALCGLASCSSPEEQAEKQRVRAEKTAIRHLEAELEIESDQIEVIEMQDMKGLKLTFKRKDNGKQAEYWMSIQEVIPKRAGVPLPDQAWHRVEVVRLKGPMWRGPRWSDKISVDEYALLKSLESDASAALDSEEVRDLVIDKVLPEQGFAIDWRREELTIRVEPEVLHSVACRIESKPESNKGTPNNAHLIIAKGREVILMNHVHFNVD